MSDAVAEPNADRPAAPPRGRRTARAGLGATASAYAYLLPTLVGLALFSAGAVLASFVMSFAEYDIVTPPVFVGLKNYVDLFSAPIVQTVIKNTFYYTLGYVPLNMVVSLGLALLANQKLRGVTLFRSIFFTPTVTSTVAIAMVFAWLYQPQFGLINYLLNLVGIRGPMWLSSPQWAMPALIILGVYRSAGYHMVIFLAGLQDIPQELYEAARIDGAGAWARLRHVTLPLISPTTFFVLVMSIIGSFQVFEVTYVLTRGGPAYSTLTLSFYIFQNAFEWFHMGYAAALSYVLFAIIMAVTLVHLWSQRHWVHYR
ncbi:MAG TPA: sugar ABC transporter permease [Chloroflexota bacterium]|nr:sugar ABC transporter permease [Chloroflexota bacterium]